ncbi:MAG: type I-E CRISPR-associated protein Cse2/CasB [Coriobacteriia bacterium]|nr:type I-E CRISPR-associated protein Cse2/CasB [Coriobacteriia bacterium]
MSKAKSVEGFVAKKISALTSSRPGLESKQRAALAKLRRGVGKEIGGVPESWEVTLVDMPEELIGKKDAISWAEQAIYTSLTLFALHQQGRIECVSRKNISFGKMARWIVNPEKSNEQTVKRRFDAVLTSKDFVEFSRHARSLIQIAKANEVYLDYPRFAKDLFLYQNPELRTKVMLAWGKDFWVSTKNNEDQSEGE